MSDVRNTLFNYLTDTTFVCTKHAAG